MIRLSSVSAIGRLLILEKYTFYFQDFLSETQSLFTRMNLEGLREDADSIQVLRKNEHLLTINANLVNFAFV